jgi:hypothetical protein
MHTSISSYLTALADKGRSLLTIKAARGDLLGFAAWWESRYSRPFDPALLRTSDLQTWRLSRQKEDAAAPATINRALVTLRAYGDWAKHAGLITENPVEEIKAIPTNPPVPKSLPAEAVDAILRAVRSEKDAGVSWEAHHPDIRKDEACREINRQSSPAGTNATSSRPSRRCPGSTLSSMTTSGRRWIGLDSGAVMHLISAPGRVRRPCSLPSAALR